MAMTPCTQDHCQYIRAKVNTHTPSNVVVVDTAHPGYDAFAGAAAAFVRLQVGQRAVPEQEQLTKSSLRCARV